MWSALLLVSTMFLAGSLLTRAGVFSDASADVINRFVVYVSLPALVLHVVPKVRWQSELMLLVIVPWLTLLVAAAVVLLLGRALGFSRAVLGALLLCAPLGNTSFLGAPLIAAVRGEGAVRYALLYDQLGSFLALSTYGLFVLASYSGAAAREGAIPTESAVAEEGAVAKEGKAARNVAGSLSFASLGRRVASFPPFIALLLALVLPQLPDALDAVFERVGSTLSPLAMFAVGMRLRLRLPAARGALALGLCVKMLLVPACAWLMVRAWGEPGLVSDVAVLEAAMPPMLSAAALASMAGLDPELCAALAGYGIALAFLLVPLLAAALG